MDNFTERARRTDAISSIAAAREIESDGTVEQQMARTLAAVNAFPNRSSLAIAHAAKLDRYLVARRLPDLRKKGLVTDGPCIRCPVSNRLAKVWNPTATR